MKRTLAFLALTAVLVVPAAAKTRRPLHLVSEQQLNQMGEQAFAEMKAQKPMTRDPRQQAAAECVVAALRRVVPQPYATRPWEVRVFEDESPNAFALPGGKVGVNTGMFKLVRSQDELAAVLGHEIGHVVARHHNERVSRQLITQTGLKLFGAYASSRASPTATRGLMTAAGGGAQLFLLLPNSRTQEAESDTIGQTLMARAGFDPAQAVTLWQHMIAAQGGRNSLQILSTHPDPQNRIGALSAAAPALQVTARAARAAGHAPKCF